MRCQIVNLAAMARSKEFLTSAFVCKYAHIYIPLICIFLPMTTAESTLKPVLVQLVFRHGDRSSVVSYPKNPYNESWWPQGYGQLSQIGMEQHYHLGKYFRQRYVEGVPYKLLNPEYKRVEISVSSTDKDRTLMSAYCHLTGMYPPNHTQIWNSNITWQPIPVHTEPLDQDHAMYFGGCPTFDRSFNETLNGDFVKKEEKENKEFYQIVAKNSGFPEESVSTVWEVFDTINCESRHPELNFKEPDWAAQKYKNQTVLDKMGELESLQFTLKYDDPLRSRLSGGTLLGEIVNNMKAKLNKTAPITQKYFIYSAHDTTVAAFASALKVFNKKFPPYTATVIVELLQDDTTKEYSVRTLYKNDSSLYTMKIPGCDEFCPYGKFLSLTKDSIPVDWKAECGYPSDGVVGEHEMIIIVASVVSGVVLVTVVLVLILWLRKQRRGNYGRYAIVNDDTATS